jgi:carboxyl-terminal processing protease
MDKENKTGFWKTFIPVALLVVVLSALGIYGISSLFRAMEKWQTTTTAADAALTEAPSTEPPTTMDPGPTPGVITDESSREARLVNRNYSAFLDRMGEIEELFTENQVLDYDLEVMHEAAMKAYVEAAGGIWDEYKNAVAEYDPADIIIHRNDSEFLDRLGEITEIVAMRMEEGSFDPAACEDAAYRGFVAGSGDIYSAYLTQQEWDDMMESSSGSYCGIGVQISQDRDTLVSQVITVFSSSPALEAGMKEGDIFKAVDGMDVTQMPLDEIVTYVRGEEGTWVDITIYRPGTGETMTLRCERRQVEVDTVYYEMLPDGIGYIELTEFDDVSVSQVRDAINSLKQQGMKKLIFDLRGNPGGLLSSVLNIADYFIKSNLLIFRMDYLDGEVYTEKSRTKAIFDGEMILLVDGNSASASEVMTGILQDYERATVMGTKTYGKGIVQSFFTLEDGGGLKVTIAHYYSPLGRDFHGVGITPDIEGEDDLLTEEDELLNMALDRLR